MRALRLGVMLPLIPFLLFGSTACYRTVPAVGGPSTAGRELVLELSERGAVELAPQLGAQLRSVTGRVTEFTGGAYHVAVSQTTDRSRMETLWRGESATIPQEYVVRVFERQLDKARSWTVAGIAVVAAALAGKAFGVDYGLGSLFGSRGGGTRQ